MQTQYELFPNLPRVSNPSTYWARYQAYMRSSAWKSIAAVTKTIAGHQCQRILKSTGERCPNTDNLDAHHLSYIAVFHERPGIDTICLCRTCHRDIHAKPIIKPDPANDNYPKWGRRIGVRC